jgi:hypothetical protein
VSEGLPTVRVAFSAIWLALQGTLVATAGARPDGAFGFRMFSESSTIEVVLRRVVKTPFGTKIVHVTDGAWMARDGGGVQHRLAWNDRVKREEMNIFDTTYHASYGARAQLARFEAALEDVATHIPEDAETSRLLLDITIRRNGREPEVFHLASRPRF